MGKPNSKIENPNANVVNEVIVERKEFNFSQIELCVLLITIIVCINLALKLYTFHNRRLKKRYMSRANELDTI